MSIVATIEPSAGGESFGRENFAGLVHQFEPNVKLRHRRILGRMNLDGDPCDLALIAEHHAPVVRVEQKGLEWICGSRKSF